MIEQIKKLRVQIDGLAQLTKELGNVTKIEDKYIPEGINPDDFIEECKIKGFPKEAITVWMPSKEINKSFDSLILAKAWLGKILGELGTESPYKAGYKTKEDIEPTADVAKIQAGLTESFNKIKPTSKIDTWELNGNPMTNYDSMNHIEKVDWLRKEVKKIWSTIMNPDFHTTTFGDDDMGDLYWNNVYTHIIEARFWLGFELQRIKESN